MTWAHTMRPAGQQTHFNCYGHFQSPPRGSLGPQETTKQYYKRKNTKQSLKKKSCQCGARGRVLLELLAQELSSSLLAMHHPASPLLLEFPRSTLWHVPVLLGWPLGCQLRPSPAGVRVEASRATSFSYAAKTVRKDMASSFACVSGWVCLASSK